MKKDYTLPVTERKKLIIAALRKYDAVKCSGLQDICGGCSDKSIRRDIEKLRDERWPIEASNDGYFLREPSEAEKKVTDDAHYGVLMIAGCSIDKNIGQFFPNASNYIKKEALALSDAEPQKTQKAQTVLATDCTD